MSSERQGQVIRGVISAGLVAAAVAAALWVVFPGWGLGRKGAASGSDLAAEALDPASLEKIKQQKDRLVVIHLEHPDHPDSGKSRDALAEADLEKYGSQLQYVHVDVKRYPKLGEAEGVNGTDAPQLVFYFKGTRVGDYRGPWNKPEVERKIEEVYRGCMERVGKDWLPEVKGMERTPKRTAQPGQAPNPQR